jgi:F420-dependent oxidoreductase-like protein
VVEEGWGLPYDRPVVRMREYLEVLLPLLEGQEADVTGELYTAHGGFTVEGASRPPVLLAALGPQMLRLAGRMADGTIVTMAGPHTLAGFIAPTIRQAAADAGRPAPRIVATVSVCVTDDPDQARERATRGTARLAALPSYAALVEREGGPPLLAGPEDELDQGVGQLEAAGVTDLVVVPIARAGTEDEKRTRSWLAGQLAQP